MGTGYTVFHKKHSSSTNRVETGLQVLSLECVPPPRWLFLVDPLVIPLVTFTGRESYPLFVSRNRGGGHPCAPRRYFWKVNYKWWGLWWAWTEKGVPPPKVWPKRGTTVQVLLLVLMVSPCHVPSPYCSLRFFAHGEDVPREQCMLWSVERLWGRQAFLVDERFIHA